MSVNEHDRLCQCVECWNESVEAQFKRLTVLPQIEPASDSAIATEWAKEILGWSPRLKAATPGFFDAARGIMAKDARIEQDRRLLTEARARAVEWHREAVRLGREVAELRERLKEQTDAPRT